MSTAIVWGARGGIGGAVFDKLVETGWQTIAVARMNAGLEAKTPYSYEADFCHQHEIQQVVTRVAQEIEEIDLFIYAAGDIAYKKVEELELPVWHRMFEANLCGPFLTVRSCLPLLSEAAHLFFIGAVSERLRLPGLTAYAAAKSGLEAFAEAFAKEQRKKHVTVVRPGAVATKFWDKVPLKMPSNAASPEKVAQKILDAYEQGHQGHLDLI